jgi:hypothetical protein
MAGDIPTMGIFPEGPPYFPGTLTLRGVIDGKPVAQFFRVDENGIVPPPMREESYTFIVTDDVNDVDAVIEKSIAEAQFFRLADK